MLRITRLHLSQFRSYPEQLIEFAPGITCLCGANGQGKSSLLEALYFCTTGSSFRTHRLGDLVQHGEFGCSVSLAFERHGTAHQLQVRSDGKERRFFHNQNPTKGRSEILGLCPSVILSQRDQELVRGAPQDRRRFMDLHLAQVDPLYLENLSRYTHALKQRNALLKQEATTGFEIWEELLAESAAYLSVRRRQLLQHLEEHVQECYRQLFDNPVTKISLNYLSKEVQGVSPKEYYLRAYAANRVKDQEKGSTSHGPHRDDFSLLIEGHEAKLFGSDGQQRVLAIALRFAEWKAMKERLEMDPLLLIDDIGTSLDPNRRARLLALASSFGQTLVTSVDRAEFNVPARYLQITLGKVTG